MLSKYQEFVKLTEVKEIVESITLPLLTQMQTREQEAINMKNTVAILSQDMKKQMAQTKQALLLKQNVQENNKNLKQMQERFAGLDEDISTLEEVLNHKLGRV